MFTKNCPNCGKEQSYKFKVTRDNAERKNAQCRECSQRKAASKRPHCVKGFKNIKSQGANNKMFGRSFVDVWREKYDEETVIRLQEEHRQKSKRIGATNGMFGKSFYEAWLEKFGKEEADKKLQEYKANKPKLEGKNNPQYGKPAPQGSGRGIKGWLDNIFFRSLLEMQYIYFRLENKDLITTAEKLQFRVAYKDKDGKDKTYHPDFYLNNQFVVEVKPSNLLYLHDLKINAGKMKFGSNYIVETEDTFPLLIQSIQLRDLVAKDRLVFLNCDLHCVEQKLKKYYKRR